MKPAITLSSLDVERIEALLDQPAQRDTALAQHLFDELARAEVLAPQAMPPGVVTMNSTVRFEIDAPREQFCLTLAYPRDMPRLDNGISILTPVGAALLGLSVGDSIAWPRPDGQLQQVRLLEVVYQPERAGDFLR
jgi:regulator of nucleoside diphosphate kinase